LARKAGNNTKKRFARCWRAAAALLNKNKASI
jgi:hypothetical protein